MLFMCHQMAMKKEASDKLKAEELRKSSAINVPIIWVLGGPGCGKGTQCAKIVHKYGFVHLSSGDLLRDEVASGSEQGKELAEIMRQGKLVSNETVLNLLEKAIRAKAADANGFLIDGYPREKDQGVAFEQKIGPADIIIFFDCADETLLARIMHRAAASTEKRADDNEETIKTRIHTFRSCTNDILSQYLQKTITLNAERDTEQIFKDVSCCLDAVISKKKTKVAAVA